MSVDGPALEHRWWLTKFMLTKMSVQGFSNRSPRVVDLNIFCSAHNRSFLLYDFHGHNFVATTAREIKFL